jgi:hypothetical protein
MCNNKEKLKGTFCDRCAADSRNNIVVMQIRNGIALRMVESTGTYLPLSSGHCFKLGFISDSFHNNSMSGFSC